MFLVACAAPAAPAPTAAPATKPTTAPAAAATTAPAAAATTAPAAAATTAPAAPPSASGKTVRIGVPANITGELSSIEGEASRGSQLAVKQINAAGGINGMLIEPFYADTKSDITTATTVVTQMIESNKVDALVGMTDTSFMLATGPVAQKA
ncbi:MAG TPA: ABC transporter substrate-binding protein, partial [Chloroflexota bacterium]|nr:ABC transporter substrate-binding protein [Chloroflexota bacterium]